MIEAQGNSRHNKEQGGGEADEGTGKTPYTRSPSASLVEGSIRIFPKIKGSLCKVPVDCPKVRKVVNLFMWQGNVTVEVKKLCASCQEDKDASDQ